MSPNPDYVDRVNRAIDYTLAHLTERPSLEQIAKVACLSPFHFHRIFSAVMGETVGQFTKRVRMERAMTLLSHPSPPSLTDVAMTCGYSSSSDFSRAFKQRHGVPPSAFDIDTFRRTRRAAMIEGLTPDDRHLLSKLPPGDNPDGFAVTMVDLPRRTVAYMRVLRPYEPGAVTGAAERLLSWAVARDLADAQWLGYMWENPDLVELDKCRYDVAVVVPEGTQRAGEVGVLELPAMRAAELAIAGPIDLEQRALDWLIGTWLPRSGMVPDDQPCFEAWEGRPFAHGTAHFELRVQLPVRDAAPLPARR